MISGALVRLAARGKMGAVLASRVDQWRSRVGPAADDTEVPGRDEVYRELWSQTGAVVDDLGDGFLVLSRGAPRVTVWNNQVPLDDPVTLRLAAHKPVAGRVLADAGLSMPRALSYGVDDLTAARRFLRDTGGPCVVKPAFGTGAGMGVTCGVVTGDDLARASVRAARWGRSLVVEEQATGDELRVLVLDGRVLGTVRRRPPRVVGNGRSTVAELVAAENDRRVAARGRLGLWRLVLDLDAVLALRRQGFTARSVPGPGVTVEVGVTANENGPADNETVASVPEAVARLSRAAVEAMGLRLAAVEVRGDAIVEVNGTPGLHYHAQVCDPSTAVDVMTPILDTLFAQERPR